MKVDMPVPRGDIVAMFGQFGARLVADLDGVTFANGCVMENGVKGAHLVVDTPQGKVTVLVIPHRTVDGTRTLCFADYQGRMSPYGKGTLAVVGGDSRALEPVDEVADARVVAAHHQGQLDDREVVHPFDVA